MPYKPSNPRIQLSAKSQSNATREWTPTPAAILPHSRRAHIRSVIGCKSITQQIRDTSEEQRDNPARRTPAWRSHANLDAQDEEARRDACSSPPCLGYKKPSRQGKGTSHHVPFHTTPFLAKHSHHHQTIAAFFFCLIFPATMFRLARRQIPAVARFHPHTGPTSPGRARLGPAFRCASSSQGSADTTSSSTESLKPSAIAQRLPDPDTIVAPHRFREFEVRMKAHCGVLR